MKTLFGSDIRMDSRFDEAVSDFGGESTIGAGMASLIALLDVIQGRGVSEAVEKPLMNEGFTRPGRGGFCRGRIYAALVVG